MFQLPNFNYNLFNSLSSSEKRERYIANYKTQLCSFYIDSVKALNVGDYIVKYDVEFDINYTSLTSNDSYIVKMSLNKLSTYPKHPMKFIVIEVDKEIGYMRYAEVRVNKTLCKPTDDSDIKNDLFDHFLDTAFFFFNRSRLY